MVVKAHCIRREDAGIFVGVHNVLRHFPATTPAIELQLGHLRIHCELRPDFWKDHPEIRDPRLCSWLRSHLFHNRPYRKNMYLAMIPLGAGAFRLQPFRAEPDCTLCGASTFGSAGCKSREAQRGHHVRQPA